MATPPTTGYMAAARRNLGRGLALVGAGSVVGAMARAYTAMQARRADRLLPDEFVLELDLEQFKLVEKLDVSLQTLLQGGAAKQLELRRVQEALHKAASDKRVRGLLAIVGARDHLGGLAMVQELRDSLAAFRRDSSGRAATVAFASAYGESGTNGTVPYYLASAMQQVYVQPSGMVSFNGLESVAFFLRGLLDKLKVRPIFFVREEFKSAANMFTQSGYTPEHRSNTEELLGGMGQQVVQGVASSRGVPLAEVQAALDVAPLVPEAALTRKLIDGMKYRDEVLDLFRKAGSEGPGKGEAKAKGEGKDKGKQKEQGEGEVSSSSSGPVQRMRRVPISRYIAIQRIQEATTLAEQAAAWQRGSWWGLGAWLPGGWSRESGGGGEGGKGAKGGGGAAAGGAKGPPQVALVVLKGAIVQGPIMPGTTPPRQELIDACRIAAQLEKLESDEQVKAVVVRVSSPGGSALGSDTIHHALMRLRRAGKHVMVSMGDVAASGGMFIAAGADRILAQPGTITGSIGVVIGKFNVQPALGELGVHTDSVQVGSNTDMLSPFKDLRPEQESQVNSLMDHVYDDFLGKVAANRGRSVAEVRPLAKGKVYTGQQAQQLGLVDQLGGLSDALELAKKQAGLPADAQVVEYPPDKSPLLVRLIKSWQLAAAGAEDQESKEQRQRESGGGRGKATGAEAGAGPGIGALVARELLWLCEARGGVGSPGWLSVALASLLGGAASPAAAAERVAAQAAALDGVVCAYSAEAQLLADTL